MIGNNGALDLLEFPFSTQVQYHLHIYLMIGKNGLSE
jgi:hypothetical protein